MKNTKGILPTGLAFVGFFVIIAVLRIVLIFGSPDPIGQVPSTILDAKQDVLQKQLEVDSIARKLTLESIYELADNGGFYSLPECGDYYLKPLWSSLNSQNEYARCVPEPYEELALETKRNLAFQLEGIPVDYEVWVEKNISISGIALKPYIVNFGEGRSYAEHLGFTLEYDYNFSTYKQIDSFVEALRFCNQKENQNGKRDLNTCVLDLARQHDMIPISPQDLFTSSETYGRFYYRELLKQLEATTYAQCAYSFEDVEDSDEIYNFVINGKAAFSGAPIDVTLGVNDQRDVALPSLPLPNQITYQPATKTLRVDAKRTDLDTLTFFKYGEKDWVFLDERADDLSEELLYKQPCSYENRMYLFSRGEGAFYPSEPELTYYFAVLIEDKLAPELPALFVVDKPFDEESLLISWKNTPSLDLAFYELYIDGKLTRTIRPWENMEIHSSIDWDYGDEISYCQLRDDGGFKQCKYHVDDEDFLFSDSSLYYFVDSSTFVYSAKVEDGLHDVRLVGVDNEGNKQERVVEGKSIDDLPYERIDFVLTEVLNPSNPELIQNLVVAAKPPSSNLDGTPVDGVVSTFRFYQDSDVKEIYQTMGVTSTITPSPPAVAGSSVYMLVVAEDVGLDNLDLSLEEMGYTTPIQQ